MAYWPNCRTKSGYSMLFPRRSERRILLIVGVCYTSSHLHLHIYADHLHIYTDHLHVFTTSHLHIFTNLLSFLSSSHLLIFTSSHLISCPLLLPLFLSLSLPPSLSLLPSCPLPRSLSFSFLSLGRGRCRRGATKWPPFRTK